MKIAEQWLEVFRVGDYGEKGAYSATDLDQLVANYDPKFHEAPACVGHPKDNKPAVGWVESLKRVGDTLYAKFKDMNPKFEELVKSGAFKKRSISFYREPKLMLRHVGFLGAMPPEVKGLADPVFRDDHEFIVVELAEEEQMDPKVFAETIKTAIAEAFAKVFGDKPPKSFSEEDAKKVAAEALTNDPNLKKLMSDFTDLKSKFDAMVAKQTAAADDATIAGKVTGVINALKAANKYLPAFDEMKLPDVLGALARSTVEVKFGEGDKAVTKSPLEVFSEFMQKLPAVVPTREIAKGAAKATGNLVKFNEAGGVEVQGVELAEAAQALATKERITYADALTRVRRQGIAGAPAAGQV